MCRERTHPLALPNPTEIHGILSVLCSLHPLYLKFPFWAPSFSLGFQHIPNSRAWIQAPFPIPAAQSGNSAPSFGAETAAQGGIFPGKPWGCWCRSCMAGPGSSAVSWQQTLSPDFGVKLSFEPKQPEQFHHFIVSNKILCSAFTQI